MTKSVDVGIVCAMEVELLQLINYLEGVTEKYSVKGTNIVIYMGQYRGLTIAIIATGIGIINASSYTTTLINHCNPKLMLFSGVAGDPSQKMAIGDIVLATSCFDDAALTHQKLADDGWAISEIRKRCDETLLDAARSIPHGNNSVNIGVIMSSNYYPAPPNYKELVAQENVIAVDMETAAFYQVCDFYKIPCLCIRSISNGISNSENEELKVDPTTMASKSAAHFCFNFIHHVATNRKKYFPQTEHADVAVLIQELCLLPHPEGGFYCQTYRSEHNVGVSKERYGDENRMAGTSIYFLLRSTDFSAWHRVKSDETWNHHKGSSLTLHLLDETNGSYTTVVIGDPLTNKAAVPQFTVKANIWFAASVNDPCSYSLVGCGVYPGFEFVDFELGDKKYLQKLFPSHSAIIKQLSRKKTAENSAFFSPAQVSEVMPVSQPNRQNILPATKGVL